MSNIVRALLQESISIKSAMLSNEPLLGQIEHAAQMLRDVTARGGTIYACGNGGSACDAMHLTEELVARYKRERPGIRAMHFMDPGTITCWSNDVDYHAVFERYAQTFCSERDALIAISTSGNSKSVLRAAEVAHSKGCAVIGLLGNGGGLIGPKCDLPIIVPAKTAERVQEAHITIIHIWCELLEC